MSNDITMQLEPMDFQPEEMDLSFEDPGILELEPMDTEFVPMKVDWLEAKSLYVADRKLTYRDIANKYGVSLKQVKKWGARERWQEGRQEVSDSAFIKFKDGLTETAAETNQRHAEMYKQAQELVTAQLELLEVQMTQAIDNAEREERTIGPNELPSPAVLLSLTRSLVTATNGERVCLGLPTSVAPAPVGYKPPVEEDPELAKLPFVERMQRILNQDSATS